MVCIKNYLVQKEQQHNHYEIRGKLCCYSFICSCKQLYI